MIHVFVPDSYGTQAAYLPAEPGHAIATLAVVNEAYIRREIAVGCSCYRDGINKGAGGRYRFLKGNLLYRGASRSGSAGFLSSLLPHRFQPRQHGRLFLYFAQSFFCIRLQLCYRHTVSLRCTVSEHKCCVRNGRHAVCMIGQQVCVMKKNSPGKKQCNNRHNRNRFLTKIKTFGQNRKRGLVCRRKLSGRELLETK